MDNEKMRSAINDLANTYFNEGRNCFIQEMKSLHRTLQQIFTGMALTWVNEFADYDYVDGRNRQSHKVCRDVVDSYRKETGQEKIPEKFPLI